MEAAEKEAFGSPLPSSKDDCLLLLILLLEKAENQMHPPSQLQLPNYATFVDGASQRFEPATSVKFDASRVRCWASAMRYEMHTMKQ